MEVKWMRRVWPVPTRLVHGMVPDRHGRSDGWLYALCGSVSTKPYWCPATNGHAPVFDAAAPDEARCQKCLRCMVLKERTGQPKQITTTACADRSG